MDKNLSISFVICILLTFFANSCNATLSKSDRKANKFETKNSKSDFDVSKSSSSSKSSTHSKDISYEEIVKEHKSFSISQSMIRHFNDEVLGYVTPWNNHGYDIAKIFAAKFTMICPVWLQMKPKDSHGGILIEGLHDVDSNWISTLKEFNNQLKIVPRVILEQWNYVALRHLYTDSMAADIVSTELINLAKSKKFDGYVLEIWSLLGGQLRMQLTTLLIRVSSVLRQHGLDLILVIPPPSFSGGQVADFTRQDFINLVDHVTAFSLMTYDYSSPQRPGPNSPLKWIIQCVKELVPDKLEESRKKLLIGLNFYGNDYSSVNSKPIIGHEYVAILEKFKPGLVFSNETGEHSFTYWHNNAKHEVYYPTLHSINIRLELAKTLNTGIAIWEIGQGLDYFYDLL